MRLLFLVLLVGTVNWVAWWIVTAFMGGDPLGVRPSEQGFVVTERGATEPVSEPLWVVLVVYTWVSQLLFPINVLGLTCLVGSIFGPFRRGPGGARSGGVEWFLVIWASL